MSQAVMGADHVQTTELYRVSARKKRSLAAKKLFSSVILHFLFHGLNGLYQKDERIREEFASWEQGFTCGIGMGEGAPALYMEWAGEQLRRLSAKQTEPEDMDLMIRFKSVEAAFLVMSGQIGIAGAYARHGFVLKGDISRAMSVVRCVDLAEAYLFPKFISKKILKEVPEKRMGLFHTYLLAVGHMIGGR